MSKTLFVIFLITSLLAIDNHILFGFDISLTMVILISAIFIYREYLLTKKNNQLKILQQKLVELNKSLSTKVDAAVHDLEKAQSVANIGSWILDVRTNKLTWSKQTYLICDLQEKPKENLFERFLARIHPEDRDTVVNTYAQSLLDKSAYNIEHRLLMDDGSVRYVLENCETTYDEHGEALVSYGTVQDITKEYLAKKDVETRDAYMLHKARLVQMGEMLSMIAHQWRQPLATISAKEIAMKMAIELEHYDVKKKEQREAFFAFLLKHLDDIETNVKYLSQTISNFKDFYKPRTNAECFDINSVIQKAHEIIRDTFEAENIELILELYAKSEVLLYENEFMQVILNLLINAQEQFEVSGTKNAKIFLRTFEDEKFVVMEIEDNGGGIQQSDLEKLFDPYFSTKMEKNGTGLGLYMAKIILERYHKSTIEAQNINQGAKFTIKIKKSKECKIF